MNNLTLHVKNFGKIKSADVEVKPLTLFVGDNNSGKSYLLSLIWALKSSSFVPIVFRGYDEELKNSIYDKLKGSIKVSLDLIGGDKYVVPINLKIFEYFLNKQLKKNKNALIKSIFNFADINIGELKISLPKEKYTFTYTIHNDDDICLLRVSLMGEKPIFGFNLSKDNKDNIEERIVFSLFRVLVFKVFDYNRLSYNCYFPAARTGFVLSRKIINQNLRRRAFDEDLEEKVAPLQQFTKPILDFLDMLEMSGNGKTDYKKLAQWIEENLAHGTYTYINDQSMELGFVPKNNKDAMPMRVASAVVTEVSPLIVLLKNSRNINSICYEEPEMCLHPQLQLYMARCLAKMVNKKIDIIATTHSDIILQHISNVCVLANHAKKEELLSSLHYDEDDVLDIKDVAVYQFTEESDGSSVTRLAPEGNAFNIPTFNDALSKIFESTYKINNEDSF